MKKLITVSLLSLLLLSCHSQDCTKLPERFASYQQAINLVEKSVFKIKETANTIGSSWLTSAKFYSCDGITGYIIYTTNKDYEYIHYGVPAYIWDGFKAATSKGTYYNANIKNRYPVNLK